MCFLFVFSFALSGITQMVDDSQNTYTRYRYKTPEGVCFENSNDRYLIKKKHNISNLLLYFKLRPLYCINCSVETAQSINDLKNVDFVMPGQILTIPKKCTNFTWQDKYDYSKIATFDDVRNKKQIPKKTETTSVTKTTIEQESTVATTVESYAQNSAKQNINQQSITQNISPNVKVLEVSYNKLGVEPFLIYSEISARSTTLSVKLVTGLGKGARIFYQRNLDTKKELLTQITAYQTEVTNDINSTTILNRPQSPFEVSGGLKYHLAKKWSVSANLGLQELLVYTNSSLNEITVKKIQNVYLYFSPEYSIYRKLRWDFSLAGGFGYLKPLSATSADAQNGSYFDLELKTSHKLNFGRVYAGINYLSRHQQNDNFTFNDNTVTYKVGTYYLF